MKRFVCARLLCAALAVLLLLGTAAGVRANEAADLDSARTAILNCYEQALGSVSLKQYALSEDQLHSLFLELLNSNALPWYADTYEFEYVLSTGRVTTFTPKDLDEHQYDRALYEQKTAEILAQTVHPGMSQRQIALSIHDYLATHCVYDDTLTHTQGYDLIVHGTAICHGYSLAYMDLMKRAGVACIYVPSDAMNHAWNMVQLDGSWYHVDVTWDDPVADCQGRVYHELFLLSDAALSGSENPHYAWDAPYTCTDTAYEADFFRSAVSSPVIYRSADSSFCRRLDGEEYLICRRDESTGEETVLHAYGQGYLDVGDSRFSYETYGLAWFADRLYFCDPRQVYSIAADGSDLRTEYSHDTSTGTGILGCFADQGKLFVTMWDLEDTYSQVTLELTNVTHHTHSYTAQITQPDCTAGGFTTYSCQCGVSCIADKTAPTAHSYTYQVIQEPSLLEDGSTIAVCSVCGSTETQVTKAAFSLPQLAGSSVLSTGLLILGGVLAVVALIGLFKRKK